MKLQIKDITIKVNNTILLSEFTYTFCEGEIYMIQGNNGTGKTTLLKAMAFLYTPQQGTICFDNININNNIKINNYRNQVSILTTSSQSLFSKLTLIQNVKFFLGINGVSFEEKIKEIKYWIDKLKLNEYLDKQVLYLSKGICQKAAILIILLNSRKIVLLDEPYDGLDREGKAIVEEMMLKYRKNRIIIMTSPIDVKTIATKVIDI